MATLKKSANKQATKSVKKQAAAMSASKKSAYGGGCVNRKCKLRKNGGCSGFEGCPGYKKR